MKTLCKIRDIQKALTTYEQAFERALGISLKEAMLLCSLAEGQCSATELASKIDLTNSNCSKVISSLERKGFIERMLGTTDKRNMFFTLTKRGAAQLQSIQKNQIELPVVLRDMVEASSQRILP